MGWIALLCGVCCVICVACARRIGPVHHTPLPPRLPGIRTRCRACGWRYRVDESLACFPEGYCGETCEVEALEKIGTL